MYPWQQPPSQPGWGGSPFNTGGPSPYGPPGYVPQPSGATAITAAVLSFLGAASNGVGALSMIYVWATWNTVVRYNDVSTGTYGGYFAFVALASAAVAAALTIGGIMLLRRRLIGRVIIAAGCGGVILMAIVNFAWAQSVLHGSGLRGLSGLGSGAFGLVLNLIMPSVTIALAFVPATTRWCLAGPPGLAAPPPSPW